MSCSDFALTASGGDIFTWQMCVCFTQSSDPEMLTPRSATCLPPRSLGGHLWGLSGLADEGQESRCEVGDAALPRPCLGCSTAPLWGRTIAARRQECAVPRQKTLPSPPCLSSRTQLKQEPSGSLHPKGSLSKVQPGTFRQSTPGNGEAGSPRSHCHRLAYTSTLASSDLGLTAPGSLKTPAGTSRSLGQRE